MISGELDNGCHAMLDEGKTEKVKDDFSADATNMDFSGMDRVIYLKEYVFFMFYRKKKKNFSQAGFPMS